MESQFGLTELKRLSSQMKVRGNDVRTIRVILAVLNIPNKAVSEARDAITKNRMQIEELSSLITQTQADDVCSEKQAREAIRRIEKEREVARLDNDKRAREATSRIKDEGKVIKGLGKIIDNFS